jgi:Carboxypeptidase regulatory-like domain/TonB-dependent Receptor Plug Domain
MKPSGFGFTGAHFRPCALAAMSIVLLSVPRHAAASQQQIDETAIVTAIVTDSAGKILPGVEVTVAGTDLRAISDDSGQIYMYGVPARKITLRARHVGFKEIDLDLSLVAGVRTNAKIVMQRAATPTTVLPKVVVQEDMVPARYAGTSRYDAFYRRRASGIGEFLTREYIDARAAERPEDLLRSVSGIRIRYRGTMPYIQFVRCDQVEVYINGFRSLDGFLSYLQLNPREIEAMEIYRGVATVPPEFSPQPNDCAAVVIWTRWH